VHSTTRQPLHPGRATPVGRRIPVGSGAGAVVAAAGLVVWLTAPSAPVQVGTNGGQMLLRGSF
jgi:hypothetical protein